MLLCLKWCLASSFRWRFSLKLYRQLEEAFEIECIQRSQCFVVLGFCQCCKYHGTRCLRCVSFFQLWFTFVSRRCCLQTLFSHWLVYPQRNSVLRQTILRSFKPFFQCSWVQNKLSFCTCCLSSRLFFHQSWEESVRLFRFLTQWISLQ